MTTPLPADPFERLSEVDIANGPLGLLMGMTDARFSLVQHIITREMGDKDKDFRALDVGCGIGLLSEPLAGMGFQVTAVDRSSDALKLARLRTTSRIDYHQADCHDLPFDDYSFDIVLCCDALEHIENPARAIAESARVLRRGGLYVYATLNRTFASWLLAIKALQDWPFSRLLPRDLHAWNDFIKPGELESMLDACNLQQQAFYGFSPGASRLEILCNLYSFKCGKISAETFGQRLRMEPRPSTLVQYFGYARKSG